MTMTTAEVLAQLRDGQRSHLPELAVFGIDSRPGFYALWFGARLRYVEISTKDPKDATNAQARDVPGLGLDAETQVVFLRENATAMFNV